MNYNLKYILGFIISAMLFFGGIFTQKSCMKCPETPKYRTEKQIVDSLLKVIPHDTIFVEGPGKIKWKPEYIHDTTAIFIKDSCLFAKVYEGNTVNWDSIPIPETYQYILSKPFVSYLDTIAKGDTISISYGFPVNQFDLALKKKPDSIYIKETTNYIVQIKHWYIGVGIHSGVGWGGGFTGQIGLSFQLGYKIAEFW